MKKAEKEIAVLKPLDTSGSNREAESTDAPTRVALLNSSEEAE